MSARLNDRTYIITCTQAIVMHIIIMKKIIRYSASPNCPAHNANVAKYRIIILLQLTTRRHYRTLAPSDSDRIAAPEISATRRCREE